MDAIDEAYLLALGDMAYYPAPETAMQPALQPADEYQVRLWGLRGGEFDPKRCLCSSCQYPHLATRPPGPHRLHGSAFHAVCKETDDLPGDGAHVSPC